MYAYIGIEIRLQDWKASPKKPSMTQTWSEFCHSLFLWHRLSGEEAAHQPSNLART